MSYLDLQGPVFLQSGALRGAPLVLDLQNFGVAPTGSVGLQYRLTQKTTLGLTYITETQFKMGGSMDANVYGLGPTPLYSRFRPQRTSSGLGRWAPDCRTRSTSAISSGWM